MLNYSANGPSGYNLTNSLRFRSSASAFLSRTPASAGNRRTWTWSGWVKRGALNGGGSDMSLFNAGTTSPTYDGFRIKSDTLSFYQGGATSVNIESTPVYRDISSWYHLVLAVDTTQATASNRVKIYVNGNQITAFNTANYPAQNAEASINNNLVHNISAQYANTSSSAFFDGYMGEINFIDGQALTPSSFGSFNSITGVWQPARYTGTYGTNGFYLNFTNIALTSGSNTGLGRDFSGNGNFWNTNNISVTSGVTYDAMRDVPTLTSATQANYATLNPLKMPAPASVSYTNGNLSVSCATANQTPALATIYPSSGKWYWEVTWTSGSFARLGVQNTNVASTDFAADTAGWRWESNTGNIYNGSNGNLSTVSTYVAGDVLGFCLDLDAGRLYVSKNGTWQNSAVPASGTGAVATNIPTNTPISPAVATGSGSVVFAMNFGQQPFSYTPPSGFVALNTFNLPTSAIVKGNSYMDATLYNGATTGFSVTNAGSFAPDMLWIKLRNAAASHVVVDFVRGSSKVINTDLTNAEATSNAGTGVLSLNSNGFTLGTDTSTAGVTNGIGTGSRNFVAWQWNAGSSTVTNTSGSISSQVRVNTTAGFSIVTYTGNGTAGATVGHGLGVAPKMFIVKNRVQGTYGNWNVWHTTLTGSQYLTLNDTSGASTNNNRWNGTVPTSTVFSLGADTFGNTNKSGDTYVAYCWAEIAGFSKFGSYTGNGSTDGVFVYLGFIPKFIIIKQSSASGENWVTYDTVRNTYNVTNLLLHPNLTNAESTTTLNPIDILSNGFKLRGSSGLTNTSSATYIYAAFAENPFKNALAR